MNEHCEDHSPDVGNSNDYNSLQLFFKETYNNNLTNWQKFKIKYLGFNIKRYIKYIETDSIVMLLINNQYHIYNK